MSRACISDLITIQVENYLGANPFFCNLFLFKFFLMKPKYIRIICLNVNFTI